VDEYAPAEQATMEALRAYWRHEGEASLRGTRLTVIVKTRFPLEHLYRYAAGGHGITLNFMTAAEFCANVPAATDKAAETSCGRIAFAMRSVTCGRDLRRLGWPAAHDADGVAIYTFDVACDPKSSPE